MTVALTSFLKYVYASIPGVPRELAIDVIRESVRQFCKESNIWRESLATANIVATQDTYPLTLPVTDTKIASLLYVRYDNTILDIKTEDELDYEDPDWRKGLNGTPDSCVLLDPTTIQFNRIPETSVTSGLIIKASLMPNNDCTVAPAELYDDWHAGVVNGALSKLMLMPKQTWSDPNQGLLEEKYFKYRKSVCRITVKKGFTQKSSSVVQRRWV